MPIHRISVGKKLRCSVKKCCSIPKLYIIYKITPAHLALSEVLELSGLDSLLELEHTLAGHGGLPAGGPLSNRLFVSGFYNRKTPDPYPSPMTLVDF
jgi:hypothetical protein